MVGISEDYIIYTDGTTIITQGEISGTLLYKGSALSKAFNAACCHLVSGGRIRLSRGTYIADEPICPTAGVTVTGSGRGTEVRIPADFHGECAFLLENTQRVTLCDFAVVGESKDFKGCAILGDNSGTLTIDDLYFKGVGEYGIVLRNSCFLTDIRQCDFADIRGSAVYLQNLSEGGRAGDFVSNHIESCKFYRCGKGILTSRAIVLNILGCSFFQIKSHAIHLTNDSNSVLISGCRSFQIEDTTVHVNNSHEINITGNIFCWQTGHGILLDQVNWGTVTGNNVIDNGSANPVDPEENRKQNERKEMMVVPNVDFSKFPNFTGIRLVNRTKGITVTGNAVFNWGVAPPMDHGIYEDDTSDNNVIAANNINCSTSSGIAQGGSESVVESNFDFPQEAYRANTGNMQVFYTALVEEFIAKE